MSYWRHVACEHFSDQSTFLPMNRNTFTASLFALIVSSALLIGCSTSQKSTGATTYTKTSTGSIVQVDLDEYHIHMPTAFPGPMVTFHVTNTGTHDHSFKISGNGVSQQLTSNLSPGQYADMSVTLTPGQYDVICPLLGHADLGMRLVVTVTAP
jgi:hypothetical protein